MSSAGTGRGISKGMKASLVFFAANVVTAGIAYITTPLFTHLLSTEEFGEVSLYLTWKQVFGIIAMFCLSYGVFNNGMSDHPDDRNGYSFSMLVLSNLITVGFSVVLFAVYPFAGTYIKLDIPLLLLMTVNFLFQPAYNFWIVRQRYEYKYKFTALFTVLSAVLSPAVSLGCILLFDDHKVYARLFGAEVTLLVLHICFFIYLGIKAKWNCNRMYWKPALKFNLPLIPHYLSTYLLASSDKIMISNMCGNSDNAFYSVAYSVASVGTIVWSAANASLIPFTYEKCKQKDYKSISNVTMPILILYGVVCVAVILLAPELVAFLATPEYADSVYVIPPVIAGIFFQVQYYMYANVIYYYKKPRYVMYASVTATVLNLILNYVFIAKFGYVAAGYTTFVCYLVQAVIDYFAMRKVVGESVYNMKFVIFFSGIMIAVCLFSGFLYGFTWIRYALLVLVFGICILFWKKILQVFKALKSF